jgi:putative spermidine/putrescine transport system ATP-binding protein
MAELVLRNLVKFYGTVQAVRDVSLTVQSGELLCILGPSGCGKSTTLRMIGGFEAVDGGDITLDGRSIIGLSPNRRPTAMVFQKYTLWPHMRVWDNVAFGLKLRHLPGAEIERKVGDALELVGLPHAARRFPNQLSGGEQQRIALARALVLEPKVLLLDEPLSNLDARLRVRMREEIKRIQRRTGITSVFVTHDQEEALSIADRIAVMSQGVLEQIDTPSRIYASPRTLFVAEFIGTMNMFDGVFRRQTQTVEVAGAHLPVGEARWDEGQRVRICIRPEDLRPVERGGPGLFSGRVDGVMDLGHFRQVDVALEHGWLLQVFVPKDRSLAAGEELHLAPARCLAFAGTDEPVELTFVGQPVLALRASAEAR